MPVHSALFAWQLPRMDAAHSRLHRVGLKKGAPPEPRQRRAGAVPDTAPCLPFLLATIQNGPAKGDSKRATGVNQTQGGSKCFALTFGVF